MLPQFSELDDCLIQDRIALRRRLKGLASRLDKGLPIDDGLVRVRQQIERSRALRVRRLALVPSPIHYPPQLPVSERRDEVARLIHENQVLVLCGETGSGKSTQLPKLCLELGRGIGGRIGHTQPRRIAARSLASRVASELGAEVGGLVGYKVRFNDRVRPETAVKLLTDGMLLAEIQQDRWLNEYDTLIIDEAHERSLNIDFLLGYLKGLLQRRRDLKLIVTSATIDPQRFSEHFGGAPIIEISGRTFPVELRHRPPEDENVGERDEAMQQAISDALAELARDGQCDVLVFLSGEREIRETADTLRKHHPPSTEILPLYARLGPQEQAKIFQPHGTRRVVLATNVAETSLTVPGIRYVVDPGFARISRYSHRLKVQRLPVERVSQASANQRKGRCGRVADGICIRLYDEDNFAARAEFTEAEIQRTNLAAVILQMKMLGFGAIEQFPFVDPPDSKLVSDGYRTLEELAAIDAKGQLTPLGRQIGRLPVDPRIGRMLLAAANQGCLTEMLIIASAMSVQDPRERPHDKQQAADEIHATFADEQSDFLAFLNLWRFLREERKKLSRNQFRKACQRHFLSYNRVQEWTDVHTQLREQIKEMGLKPNPDEANYEQIHAALLPGLLSNIGLKDEHHEYEGARGSRFRIHPSSGLFKQGPKWLVAGERLETTRQYGRLIAKVQPGWIEEAGSHLVKRSYSEPHWQSKSGQVAAYVKVTLFGVTLVPRRRVNFGPINPTEAREVFLRSALVDGDFDTRAPFWRHNRELIDYIQHLEAKSRRRDILVDEEAILAFYNERVPSGIYSKPQFEQWLRKATKADPKLLHMSMADAMAHDAAHITEASFPDRLQVAASALPLEYHFDPGSAADGVTLVVPIALINQVSPDRADWLVPGLIEERIAAMLRGLPKAQRKAFVPVPETAAKLAQRLQASDRPLIQAMGEELKAMTGVQVPEDAWNLDGVPDHLRMKFRVVDANGKSLATDTELTKLKRRFAKQGSEQFSAMPSHGIERDGIKRWDFGELPERIDLSRGGIRLRGFPALIDQGDSVAIKVLDSEDASAGAQREGLRRLIQLHLAGDVRYVRKNLGDLGALRLRYAKAPPPPGGNKDKLPDIADELIALVLDLTFVEGEPPLRDQAAFEARLVANKSRMLGTASEVSKLAAGVLTTYQTLRKRLDGITQLLWMNSVLDMRAQLDALVYRGFLGDTPYANLKHLPRYLEAAAQRAEKLKLNAAKDKQWMAEMAPILSKWRERSEAAAKAGRRDPRLDEIRWMLEELRVSLFAQQLGTAYPVSVKRIQVRWKALGL